MGATGRAAPQPADSSDPGRLLRLSGERRGEEGDRASQEGPPVHYSIT
jgi:hypothetical protein